MGRRRENLQKWRENLQNRRENSLAPPTRTSLGEYCEQTPILWILAPKNLRLQKQIQRMVGCGAGVHTGARGACVLSPMYLAARVKIFKVGPLRRVTLATENIDLKTCDLKFKVSNFSTGHRAMHTVFTRGKVAPKHKTHPQFYLGFLVSGCIKIIVISYRCTRCTPTFGVKLWGKKLRFIHGWIRYV